MAAIAWTAAGLAALVHSNSLERQRPAWLFGAALGIGRLAGSAMEGISRQPEAAGDIRTNMILTAALIEGVALIGEVVALLVVLTK